MEDIDSNLSIYELQTLGLYAPKWRLKKSIYVERQRPAGMIMGEVLLSMYMENIDNNSLNYLNQFKKLTAISIKLT